MQTPRILKVVCRGTAELDAKSHFYKVIVPYIESLSRLGAIPRCNPATLTTRNVDRLKNSFEEDIVPDLNDADSRRCRLELEILYILYRALELFELQGSQVAISYLSDIVEGSQAKNDVRFELIQNEKFEGLRFELTKIKANKEDLNDTITKNKIVKLADIVENYLRTNVSACRILIAVPTAAVCEEVNKMLACLSTLVASYVYDTSKYNANTLKNFIDSSDNCIVVISSPDYLKGLSISLAGISLAICLDVQKNVLRKPPHWQGLIHLLVTDIENKSFQGSEVLATSPKKPPATLKRGLANQASKGRKGFLTKEEQNYFDRYLKSSTKIILPSSEADNVPKSQAASAVHLSLTRWRPWQSRLQETFQVGHSTDSQLLVDVFEFCDELSKTSEAIDAGDREDELAAHLRAEDVHLCPEDSGSESDCYIGADVDSFDEKTFDFLSITADMDRYVLDSAEKITNYLAELGLTDEADPNPVQENQSEELEPPVEIPDASPEKSRLPEPEYKCGTPVAVGSRRIPTGSVRFETSPLAVAGRLPMASTPFTGCAAPRANFKMTPIADKQPGRQQSTPNSHWQERTSKFDPESSPDGTKLSLTALVNVVQKRKKQKNLQYFFSDKANQQAQLSDVVEAIESSSKEEIRETIRDPRTETSLNKGDRPRNLTKEADEDELFASTVCHDSKFATTEKPQELSRNCQEMGKLSASEKPSNDVQQSRPPPEPLIDSKPACTRDDAAIDAEVFENIEIIDDEDSEDCFELDGSIEEISEAQAEEKIAGKQSEKVTLAKVFSKAPKVKLESKPKIRSVFDAMDDFDKKEDSLSTHKAVLNIINNIPTRSKEVEVIAEEVEPEGVGNILPEGFHNEIKRTSDDDENSDDLFDCVEEPIVAPVERESHDVVLEKLLKKAKERSSKATVDKPCQSAKEVPSSQETVSMKNKGFRKQKFRDIVDNGNNFERGDGSPESLKMSFSAPSRAEATKSSGVGVSEKARIRSESQRESSSAGSKGIPLVERELSHIFESRSSELRKRTRSSSSSSEDTMPIQKRKKKPCSSDGASSVKPVASGRAFRDKVKNKYFDEEAEVDSIDSFSEDEDDRADAYEMNSFVDDGEPIAQSQGMYHRLNRELSPRKPLRRPVKHVPYEDCFSQRPPSEEDTYGEDSFVEHGSVSEVTLPAEITIMQAPPEPDRKKKKKKKGARRAFIRDESSEADQSKCQTVHSVQQGEREPKCTAVGHSKPLPKPVNEKVPPKNVILVNTAILEILPEILIGLQRTFTASHIEPVDMSSFGNHPVDFYVGGSCIKLVTLKQLQLEETKTRGQLHRLKPMCEKPVLLVMTPANDQNASERLFKTIIEISDMDMRTFFVKNQVELLMLLKCIATDLSPNEWLIDFLESEELHHLLRIPHLNVLTATALLREKGGRAQEVIRSSSVGDIERICNVSKQCADTICAAFRVS